MKKDKVKIIFGLFFVIVALTIGIILMSREKNQNAQEITSDEIVRKLNDVHIPVFKNSDPNVVIEAIYQSINVVSPLKFSYSSEGSQWWISEDGWNIIVRNATTITMGISAPYRLDQVSSINPISPISRELNNAISRMFIDNGFKLNIENSSGSKTDRFYDYVVAFKKDETRCTLTINGDDGNLDVACSNQFQEAYEEQIPYLRGLNDRNDVVELRKKIGDFVYLSVHARRAGYAVIGKMEGEKMEVIYTGQDTPDCDLMNKNKVPKEIYKDCHDHTK